MTEHDFQTNIVNTLKQMNVLVFSIPNGQSLLSKIPYRQRFFMMSYLKREGLYTGASDLIVVNKGKVYFVEVKAPTEYTVSKKTGKRIISKAGGKQSDAQKKFQAEIEKEGLPYVLIDSHKTFEEFLNTLKNKSNYGEFATIKKGDKI